MNVNLMHVCPVDSACCPSRRAAQRYFCRPVRGLELYGVHFRHFYVYVFLCRPSEVRNLQRVRIDNHMTSSCVL